jgi:hypothetical protein
MRNHQRANAHRRCGEARWSVQLASVRTRDRNRVTNLIARKEFACGNQAVPKRKRVVLVVAEGAGEGGEFVGKRLLRRLNVAHRINSNFESTGR